MEIEIDSFASGTIKSTPDGAEILENLLARIEYADQSDLTTFGIGEHHRQVFFNSAPANILTVP